MFSLLWVMAVSIFVLFYVSILTRKEDPYTWGSFKIWGRYVCEYTIYLFSLMFLAEFFLINIPFWVLIVVALAAAIVPYNIRDAKYTQKCKDNGYYWKFKSPSGFHRKYCS